MSLASKFVKGKYPSFSVDRNLPTTATEVITMDHAWLCHEVVLLLVLPHIGMSQFLLQMVFCLNVQRD